MVVPSRITNPLKLTQTLFYINAGLWVVLGIASLLRLNAGGRLDPMGAILVGMLMFGNAFILLLAGIGLAERARLTYLFAVLILLVNIGLTFTDQLGWFDLLTLLLDLIILAFLFIYRRSLSTR